MDSQSNNPSATPPVQTSVPIQPQKSNSMLPFILVVLGIIETLLFAFNFINLIFVVPKLQQLYTDTNVKPTTYPFIAVAAAGVFALLSISEVVYGFWLINLQKKQSVLPVKHNKIVKAILIATILVFLLWFVTLIYSTILPIYNLHSAFN